MPELGVLADDIAQAADTPITKLVQMLGSVPEQPGPKADAEAVFAQLQLDLGQWLERWLGREPMHTLLGADQRMGTSAQEVAKRVAGQLAGGVRVSETKLRQMKETALQILEAYKVVNSDQMLSEPQERLHLAAAVFLAALHLDPIWNWSGQSGLEALLRAVSDAGGMILTGRFANIRRQSVRSMQQRISNIQYALRTLQVRCSSTAFTYSYSTFEHQCHQDHVIDVLPILLARWQQQKEGAAEVAAGSRGRTTPARRTPLPPPPPPKRPRRSAA
eukprot:TRINITY_DN1136_c6_g1_i1.p1 TRINITY_DN1136_c6_g1~~TRINITY_DN1136_c6_g1_i1.p1  ORF type:complete len:275 (+),score=82.38 TRINITY_DN1136_c6_g1_i1:418-1242(+)